MLNHIVLVGRLTQDLEVKELEDGRKVCYIILAVPRSYKNEDGEYDTDYIPCTLFGGVAENTAKYCKEGTLIGVKGRIESIPMASVNDIEIIVDKVTFLSTKGKED